MKRAICGAAFALLCLIGRAHAADPRACDVTVDVTDPDPRGTNVRATPGGQVIGVLNTASDPSADDWIEVHVIAQAGDWFRIDRADLVGDDRKTIFRGRGYVHRSVLGASGLQSHSQLRADHDDHSRLIAEDLAGDQDVRLLGCWGAFARIRVREGVGWTRTLCLNQRTTCV